MIVCSLQDRQVGREANQRIASSTAQSCTKSVAECNERDEFQSSD
jgi:hypothetical protein